MSIEVNGTSYATDENGYLLNLGEWTEDVAKKLAEVEEIDMTEEHWNLVNFLRGYYEEYQIAPAVKILTKAIANEKGMDKKDALNSFISFSLKVPLCRLVKLQDCRNLPAAFKDKKNCFQQTSYCESKEA